MDEKEFLDWLNREDILHLAKRHSGHFEKVLQQCLDVKDEKLLLIGDYGYPTRRVAPLLTACYYFAAKKLKLDVDFVFQDPKTGLDKSEQQVIDKMFDLSEKSSIVVNMSGKIGQMNHVGKSFRKFCDTHKHRFISTLSLSTMDTYMIKGIIDAVSINYNELQSQDKIIKSKIVQGKVMTIKTKAGTDLKIDLREVDVRMADGDYKEFGKGGNLPAGEVYFAPTNVNGTVVIDGSMRNKDDAVLIQNPITIIVEDNKVVAIKGDEEARLLNESLSLAESRAKYPERVRYLAEIGIGTNPKAKLVGATIVDEKAFGTAHVAIGSNYWFGGKNRTIVHYDQVFKSPRIRIDGEVLRF
jgi:leucyl aminopeptidase (aminopeptidase T)